MVGAASRIPVHKTKALAALIITFPHQQAALRVSYLGP
jgi:hypothetical protein